MGKFVVLEGPDHSGKTTQMDILREILPERYPDRKFMFTREPGGPEGKLSIMTNIRKLILSDEHPIDPLTEIYLYAAARAAHVLEIQKWLHQGYDVVSDRFVQSSIVYQGIARGISQKVVEDINNYALSDVHPDQILFFDLPLETYRERRSKQIALDRIEQQSEEFHEKVIAGYSLLYRQTRLEDERRDFSPAIAHRIQADAPITEVQHQVLRAFHLLFNA